MYVDITHRSANSQAFFSAVGEAIGPDSYANYATNCTHTRTDKKTFTTTLASSDGTYEISMS